jgi:hypothetical protein
MTLAQRRRTNPYLSPLYDEVRRRSGLTVAEIEQRVRQIRGYLMRTYKPRTIANNRLDSPYMTEGARRCLINDMEREMGAGRGRG